MIKKWRGQGIKSIIFIDDGICGGKGYHRTKYITETIISDLAKSGLKMNFENSCLEPTQKGKWLGLIIDTKISKIFVPEEKIEKLVKSIKDVLAQTFCSAKQLAQICGQLSSMHLALGPIVRLFTRNLYCDIESRIMWYHPMQISKNSLIELEFWLRNLDSRNGFTFKPRQTTSKIVFTDASETGYGGFIAERLNEKICVGKFTPLESNASSTTRELIAVKNVLKCFGNKLANESVQVNIDNISASRILTVGSSKPSLTIVSSRDFQSLYKVQY